MLLTALKPDAELRTTPPRLLPLTWRPGNFLEVLGDPGFADWLRVSLVVAGASTAIVVLAAAPAAYYTARHRFPGRTAFLFVVLVTQMFSPTALVVGLYREFFELDHVNTYAARSEEHASELQSRLHLVCRLLLEKKKRVVSTLCQLLHAD